MKQSNYQCHKSAYSIYTSGRPMSSSLREQMRYSCSSSKARKRRVTQAWITSACFANADAPEIRIMSATGNTTQAGAMAAVTGGGFGDLPPFPWALGSTLHVMHLIRFRPRWQLYVGKSTSICLVWRDDLQRSVRAYQPSCGKWLDVSNPVWPGIKAWPMVYVASRKGPRTCSW